MAKYCRVSYAERKRIEQLKNEGRGVREIGRVINRSPSTVSWELSRKFTQYNADTAHQDALSKQQLRTKKKKIFGALESIIIYFLIERHFSPEQISGHLKKVHPDSPDLQISPEAVYSWVYKHEQRKTITQFLRRKRPRRRIKGQSKAHRGGIKNRVSIKERPSTTENRKEIGHWEGDLIMGAKNQSAVGTLVERSTRYTILVKLESKESENVVEQFIRFLKRVPPCLRRSLTYDNGSEMAHHEKLSEQLSMKVYFADPRSPWQRGTNENTNGLVREFLPKSTDLSQHSREKLAGIAALLNRRPRKVLGFNAPADMFDYFCMNPGSSLPECLHHMS